MNNLKLTSALEVLDGQVSCLKEVLSDRNSLALSHAEHDIVKNMLGIIDYTLIVIRQETLCSK